MEVYSRWGGQDSVGWHEVESVHLSSSRSYTVRLHDGRAFKFNDFMSGYQSLLDEIQARGRGRSRPGPMP